jgi:putative endonuclease
MAYYVYFLKSLKNGRYYVGVSSNVTRRLREHNSGLSKFTAPFRPYELKRVEKFTKIEDAYRREVFIKKKKSKKIIEVILKSKN